MDLSQELPEGFLHVRALGSQGIRVVDELLERSFLLLPDRIVHDWPVQDVSQLDDAAIAAILELQPEIVLLGTGPNQVFPPVETLRAFIRHGVGVEVMDNAAAARTYNLLAGEGRNVLAALILPTG